MKRWSYIFIAWGAVLGTIPVGIAFVGFFGLLPLGIACDAQSGPLWEAVVFNTGLLTLFGLQHTGMARESYKRAMERTVPRDIERSIYVWASNVALLILLLTWRGMPGTIWAVEGVGAWILMALSFSGAGLVLIATKSMGGGELLGLTQLRAFLRGEQLAPAIFKTPLVYRIVRHPIQLGVLMIFWSWPVMTQGRAFFALGMTAYILIGLYFEEKGLVEEFGEAYESYRRDVPMLLPWKGIRN